MIRSYEDSTSALLNDLYSGEWEVWYVRSAILRVTTWCARPVGHPIATIKSDTPEDLCKQICKAMGCNSTLA